MMTYANAKAGESVGVDAAQTPVIGIQSRSSIGPASGWVSVPPIPFPADETESKSISDGFLKFADSMHRDIPMTSALIPRMDVYADAVERPAVNHMIDAVARTRTIIGSDASSPSAMHICDRALMHVMIVKYLPGMWGDIRDLVMGIARSYNRADMLSAMRDAPLRSIDADAAIRAIGQGMLLGADASDPRGFGWAALERSEAAGASLILADADAIAESIDGGESSAVARIRVPR